MLIHTGEWPNWDDSLQMPNSAGCIHIHPDDLGIVDQIVTESMGVVIHPNPFTGQNYPYVTQGIISIELIH